MHDKEFSILISKSSSKKIIVGGFVFAFGLFIMWMMLSGGESESDDIGSGGQIVIWALVVLCIGSAGLIGGQAVRSKIQLRLGKHPLQQAIASGDTGHLVWIYEKVSGVRGRGSDHYIYAYNSNNKLYLLSLNKKRIAEAMRYLQSKFPNAVFGYSEEIVAQMKTTIGDKIK